MNVYCYEVRVNNADHEFELTGPILSVGCRHTDAVEFWALHRGGATTHVRTFRVFGTGQSVPEDWMHVGTVRNPDGVFAWHLFERPSAVSHHLSETQIVLLREEIEKLKAENERLTCAVAAALALADSSIPVRPDKCSCEEEYGNNWCGVHVNCDEQCGALLEPASAEQISAAYEHWSRHRSASGCSHGC